MGARGELYTTQIHLDNRSYFFNVKENRTGDVFLQIVESKNRDGAEADRHQIAVFSEDMREFLQGLDKSLDFIEKDRRARQKAAREKKAAKEAKYGKSGDKAADSTGKKVYKMKKDAGTTTPNDGIKRTGRIHVVSKKTTVTESPDSDN